jgi:hypothetical protein
VEDGIAVFPASSSPIGTYESMRTYPGMEGDTLHSVHSLGERPDDKLLVLPRHLRIFVSE